jgi:type VI secretion system protein ImpA
MTLQIDLPFDRIEGPVSEENWVGSDPREDSSPSSPYRQARDNRQAARALERQAAVDGVIPVEAVEHWRTVRDASINVLTEQAKDLEMAACLTDALVRTDGLDGLAAGMRVFRLLVEKYWGLLFPRPDESFGEGPEETLRPLEDLNTDAFLLAVGHVAISADFGDGPMEFWRYAAALSLEKASDTDRADRIERGAVTLEELQRAVQQSGPEFCQALNASIAQCQQEFKKLEATLIETCVDNDGITVAPALSALGERIEEMGAALRRLAGGLLEVQAAAMDGSLDGSSASGGGAGGAPAAGDGTGLRSREDAFAALHRIADFMARLEPQSLLPSMIRKVVVWGRLPPEDFYKTIINDNNAREWLFDATGMQLPPDPEDD